MRHLVFSEQVRASYPICLLTPDIHRVQIQDAYLTSHGIDPNELLVLSLHRSPTAKKTPMKEMVAYITEELAPVLTDMQVEYLLVADSDYFKALTKAPKVEANLGYVMDCVYGPWKIVYIPNYRQIFYDPDKVKAKITLAIEAVKQHRLGNYERPGASIIKFAAYPETPEDIEQWLERLIVENRPLTCDIEGFSLKHHTAGIGTITFCWSKHEGIAFPVDYEPIAGATEAPFGRQTHNARVRQLLLSFFRRFKQKIIYHSIAYDAYVLIYQLFMKHILDTEGMLTGMKEMLRCWDDTKLIAYLATNSCAGNQLKLKILAQEFAGNYAVEEIEDITRIPLSELLQYNLVDGLSTWFVYEKFWDQMVADQQLDIYRNLFQPATWDIIQMQLTGLPLNMERVKRVKLILQAFEGKAIETIANSKLVQKYTYKLREAYVAKRNAELKVKRISINDAEVAQVVFNPKSAPQLQALLYTELGLPVIARSDSRLPSTKGKVLKDLQNHTSDPEVKKLLEALVDFKAVAKILTDFIPSFENAAQGPDDWHYLFGNFNLGGTISGRLSSSDPNLQNLPSNVYMTISDELFDMFREDLAPFVKKGSLSLGKLIKSCFEAPPGWLFVGLDFASLEDKISALTTKDPNKLKVYTDGYDGHCLRAHAYFGDQMPDIRLANGRRTFKVIQGGKEHCLFEGELVQLPGGETRPIEEIYGGDYDQMGKGTASDA
jgi:DNA polymerase-1